MHPCMYACKHACLHVCVHVCMHACMHVCTDACMYASMHACMQHAARGTHAQGFRLLRNLLEACACFGPDAHGLPPRARKAVRHCSSRSHSIHLGRHSCPWRTCIIRLAEVVSDDVGPHVGGAQSGRRVHSVVRGHLDPGRTRGHTAAQTLEHVQRRPACDLPRRTQHQQKRTAPAHDTRTERAALPRAPAARPPAACPAA